MSELELEGLRKIPDIEESGEKITEFSVAFYELLQEISQSSNGQEKNKHSLSDYSNEQVSLEIGYKENMEGSLYLNDKESGDVVRFRWLGRDGDVHIYLRDSEGLEKLYLVIDRDSEDLNFKTIIRNINRRQLKSFTSDAEVVYRTSQNQADYDRAFNKNIDARGQVQKMRNNRLVKLLPQIITDRFLPYPEGPRSYNPEFVSTEIIPASEVDFLFERLASTFSKATNAIESKKRTLLA